jgi:hypothetical protein
VLIIVVRSKLVADFAFTVHFIHLVITTFYTHSLPSTLFWWAVQGFSAVLMTVLGVWACQWRELRPISFGFGATSNSSNTTTASNRGDAGVGFPQGTSAGRGRDGGGTYELVDRSDNV